MIDGAIGDVDRLLMYLNELVNCVLLHVYVVCSCMIDSLFDLIDVRFLYE